MEPEYYVQIPAALLFSSVTLGQLAKPLLP